MIMKTQKDKYDLAVEYLTEHPEEIYHAWRQPNIRVGGCLFKYCQKEAVGCGCLTQVKYGIYPAETEALTKAIRKDRRIPVNPYLITVKKLSLFAQWQRRIDKELGRSV